LNSHPHVYEVRSRKDKRGTAASAYGAASSLITLLVWVYYSSQILVFGAEFIQVYASEFGSPIKPDKYAVQIERQEIEKSDRKH
jgi:Predicted membrane protein